MFFKKAKFFLLGVGLLQFANAHAVERHRSFYSASRALAMGDAFTAYGQGFESVYYNPAGVARRSTPKLKYFDALKSRASI